MGKCLFYLLWLVIPISLHVQTKIVSGKVTSPENELLPLRYAVVFGSVHAPIEGWTQNRRSDIFGQEIPAMSAPMSAQVAGLMRRLLYRGEEVNSNPNTPFGVILDAPLWFDK